MTRSAFAISRAFRSVVFVALLCNCATAFAEPTWSSEVSPLAVTISPLLEARSAPQQPALLRYLKSAGDNSAFADAARGADALTTLVVASRLAEMPAAVIGDAAAAIGSTVGPTVLEQLAFETALEAQLGGRAPAPALQPVWAKIAAAYGANHNKPLWRNGDRWSASARAALIRISLARDDALALPALAPASLIEGSPEMIAAQDLALTSAVVAYARQAAGDRVDPLRISRLITSKPVLPEPRDIIAAVAQAGDHASDVLVAYNPPHAGYRALRAKLAELRHASTPMATRIPAGPPLRVGMRDPRVKLIRARFGLEIALPQTADDIVYDTQVAEAVAGFQRENGLQPNGVLTPRTVALLSGGEPGKLETAIVVNMERWRWMPRDLGTDRIEVDVPSFSLSLVRNGAIVHRARVIVGKPTNPTPIFSNAMKFIVVNPSWYIPPSILKNEILPKLAGDPGYLQRLGYEMTVKRGQVSVRQPPGERNALGRIKFMFPNEHSVYLHDTPSRGLFASARRAFSHGCVRVDDPMALAAAVLRGTWTESRIKALVGGSERTLNLPAPLPIHIEYFTASIGADGRLQFRDDLYGYDKAMARTMALNDLNDAQQIGTFFNKAGFLNKLDHVGREFGRSIQWPLVFAQAFSQFHSWPAHRLLPNRPAAERAMQPRRIREATLALDFRRDQVVRAIVTVGVTAAATTAIRFITVAASS